MSRQQRYNAEVDELLRESRNVSLQVSARVFRQLQDARAEIVSRIAFLRPDSFSAAQLEELLRQIDTAMREFAQKAGLEVRNAQAQQWRLGEDLVDRPLITAGESSLLFRLDPARLAQWQRYSSTLIGGLSGAARNSLEREIRRASIGGQQIADIIARVGKILEGTEKSAVDITFNEVNRMQSISTYERLLQMRERLGDRVEKEWRHNGVGIPRQGHKRISGITVPVDALFQIPEYFPASGGGKPVPAETARYPRDPMLSAANSINCHCTVVPAVKVPERSDVPRFVSVSVERV